MSDIKTAPSDEGAGVRWTPLQSRSTDRGGSRDGGKTQF